MTAIDETRDGTAGTDVSVQLRSVLDSARHLLASTAGAVHPGVPADELLTHLTDYRGHLSGLVSAGSLVLAGRSPDDLDARQG